MWWLVQTILLILMALMAVHVQPTRAKTASCSFPNYDSNTRPDPKGAPTQVAVGLYIIDIPSIQNTKQTFTVDLTAEVQWRDSRLRRNALAPSSDTCILGLDEVWNPQMHFLNARGLTKESDDRVQVDAEGMVTYRQRFYGDFTTFFHLDEFPFDRQVLRMMVVSDYGPKELTFVAYETYMGHAESFSISDWTVGSGTFQVSSFYFAPNKLHLSRLDYELIATRHTGYYVIKIILPLAMIVILSWTVFWIDPAQLGPQMGIAASVLLTLMVYLHRIGDLLPQISYLTILDEFILGSLALVFFAFLEAVFTCTLAGKGMGAIATRIDRWSRWVFPISFTLILIFSFWM